MKNGVGYEGSLKLNRVNLRSLNIENNKLYRLSIGEKEMLALTRTKGSDILKRIKELNCQEQRGRITSAVII